MNRFPVQSRSSREGGVMTQRKWKQVLRYRFDNFMSRGTIALIGALGLISLCIILIAGILINLLGVTPEGSEKLGFWEGLWQSLMRAMDAGTLGGDSGWGFRFLMFVVTIGGIFIISGLIGVLTSGLERRLEELRKGRSKVIEKDHTVILGWSLQVFTIISELVTANENRHKPCIVILGDKDKVEMEDEINDKIGDTKNTRIVCRSGSPLETSDLEMVNIDAARSIIILSPEKENPDVDVIKTILAITNNPRRKSSPYYVIGEIQDPKNLEVAKMVGKDEVELLLVGDLISRVIAQTCRQSGLSIVYTELLDFGGDEIYFKEEPSLQGETYGEILAFYEDSAVIGFNTRKHGVRINPPMDTVLEPGDEVIAISEDDDTLILSGKKNIPVKETAIRLSSPQPQSPEKTLILGWNRKLPAIINELDAYVTTGSTTTVVAEFAHGENEIKRLCPSLKNMSITYRIEDTTDRRVLDNLEAEKYNHIILLCYSDQYDPQDADAKTLITLLHLRDIAEKLNQDFSIVSEMMDVRDRILAEISQADDFIVSANLVSLMLTQISENKYLNSVFADLFDPEGSEIYMKYIEDYIQTGEPVNFYTVLEAARKKGETAIGYRLKQFSTNAEKAYGVVVNPDKSREVVFSKEDRIIVLAES
jgi:voltage-gated potassium channel Kch